MARYAVTHSKAGVNTANTHMWGIRAASTDRLYIYELGLAVKVAPTTGPSFRLNRATAVGTSSASVVPQPEDPDVTAAVGRLDTAWSAGATAGAVDMREYAVPNSIGSGIVWTWYDQPLIVPKSGAILIINGNATGTTLGTLTIYAVLDE
jgi:hypothetical protein